MYYSIKIKNVDATLEDQMVAFLFEQGASGVSENLDFEQPGDTYETKIHDKNHKDLEAYFTSLPPENLKANLEKTYDGIVVDILEEEEKDWLMEWKKDFKAFPLVNDIWLVPSWLKAPDGVKQTIRIDPGMAFGTGTHATTKLCAETIFELLEKEKISTALDVGCGTAILSILCEMLGVQKVEATEIDPIARECAIENVKNNQCQNITIHSKQVETLEGAYDLVVANIIDGVLLSLKEDLIRLTRPGAYIILSGVLDERSKNFEKAFFDSRLEAVKKDKKEDWFSYILKKKA